MRRLLETTLNTLTRKILDITNKGWVFSDTQLLFLQTLLRITLPYLNESINSMRPKHEKTN